ncbi:hypothetical protein MNBD_GAMMA11-2523 [hydrothermal vent metagenome]|uniref:PABS domain-containing protein n=1 Tax=hydrothermal vent metagenome TaxID=652676 RepID=A0A3B0XII3_9ZZZZ
MQHKQILTLAFLNGAGIMAFEMICGKMLAPFYGTSLEVWAVTLAVVMSGLALGYWIGGRHSVKHNQVSSLCHLLFYAAIAVAVAPLLGKVLFAFAYNRFGTSGSIISSMVIILPYMVLAGMVSPILTQITTTDHHAAGESAGKIFSLSTIGGVLATFLTGYWMIPSIGLEYAVVAVAGIYFVISFILLAGQPFKLNRHAWVASLLSLVLICTSAFSVSTTLFPGVLYRQSGLYGELMVADIPLEYNGKTYPRRMLLNNRVGQTNMNTYNKCSLWDYAHYLTNIAGAQPENSNALLLGLAGGSIANEFINLNFNVDTVDLDPRVYQLASTFFNLSEKINFIEDDARHYLNTHPKIYDLIVIDLFTGEGVPNHILTRESLELIKKRLSSSGILIINFHGYLQGDDGKGARAVYKTLVSKDFNTRYLVTPGKPGARNTLFVATTNKDPQFFSNRTWRTSWCSTDWRAPSPPLLVNMQPSMYKDAPILQDEYPILDRLNKAAYADWRKYTIEHHLIELNKKGLPFF